MSAGPPTGDDPVGRVLARLGLGTELGASSRLPTGVPSREHALGGGFHRDDLVVLGGAVSAGTSALALAMAVRAPGGAELRRLQHPAGGAGCVDLCFSAQAGCVEDLLDP